MKFNKFEPNQNGFTYNQNVNIYYECFGNKENTAIILIMGLDAQCILWDSDRFIKPLVNAGFYVIRFDNRDIGLSTWLQNWNRKKPYTLENMAEDTIAVLDRLSITKCHVIGASMGGMIAQRLLINYPNRFLKMVGIMTTANPLDSQVFGKLYQKVAVKIVPALLKNLPLNEKYIQHKITVPRYVATFKFLTGKLHLFERQYFIDLFNTCIHLRKGQNPRAMFQQVCAIIASGSREKELVKINTPSLYFHGTADPLLNIAHARKYVPMVANAQLVELQGVGHTMPKDVLPLVLNQIISFLKF